ncbi:MAG: hypothetical protein KJ893_05240 [Candidatus Omnitrophica bacterium]|nr:hypothetical protein [Candidatus Omnitrophota bacterium]MCG2726129.1 hypothetical protein [Elusimicrobiota bacterium]
MKKVLITLALSAGLSLMSNTVFAWDYVYTGNDHSSVPMAKNVVVNIDDYMPWNSGGSARALGMGGAFTAIANDMGAVEYNPAGLAKINLVNVSALAVFNRSSEVNADGNKSTEWSIIPTYGGASIKIWKAAFGLSLKNPYFPCTYAKFSNLQRDVFAPDGYPMRYDSFSDTLNTDGLKTYALTVALDMGRMSFGANYNIIKGDIERSVRGRVSLENVPYTNGTQFNATDTTSFDGHTMDIGVLMDLGVLRLGAAAKNIIGKVDVKQDYYWKDNFAMGAGFFVYDPVAVTRSITKFAPTYSVGAALVFGDILTIDMDYVTVDMESSEKAMGRLGAELWVIPGFFAARGGVKTDFKNVTEFRDQKTMEYFVGAGFKLVGLTVDAAASMAQAKEGADGSNMTGAVSATLKF